MEFKDTSEYVYLSVLSSTFDTLITIIDTFSEEQLQVLIPKMNYINDILNLSVEDLTTNRKSIN